MPKRFEGDQSLPVEALARLQAQSHAKRCDAVVKLALVKRLCSSPSVAKFISGI